MTSLYRRFMSVRDVMTAYAAVFVTALAAMLVVGPMTARMSARMPAAAAVLTTAYAAVFKTAAGVTRLGLPSCASRGLLPWLCCAPRHDR